MNFPCTPAALAALLAVLSLPATRADLFVSGTVTPAGGTFRYSLSIENTGPDDIVLVSITDAPLLDPLIGPSLTSPFGFLGSYDGGLGFIDFVEDTDLFAAGSLHGPFLFDSLTGPGSGFSIIEAMTDWGGPASGTVNLQLVPEPAGAAAFFALGLLARALCSRRRPHAV